MASDRDRKVESRVEVRQLLQDEGGFTPTIPFVETASDSPLDGAWLGAWPFTAQRGSGFGRRVDGDADGTAPPDSGAFEVQS